jgi:2-polyprenyl-3-methyl-5-hydroxy-6-metoxy-1,4-benzoquinol methylase
MKDIAYEKNYEHEETHWWFRARKGILLGLIKRYAVDTPLKILDYGCGTGLMLGELRVFGDVWGSDFSEAAQDFCRRRGHANVVGPDNIKDQAPFGLITMLDVVEHVDDDAGLMKTIRGLLSSRGIVVITVPAFRWLWSGEDYVSEHKRRYTKNMLRSLIANAGFEIVKISYFNSLLLPLIFAVVKFKNIFVPASRRMTNLNKVPAPLNALFYSIFRSEGTLLKYFNLPAGVSLVCVARKTDD